LFFNNKYLLFYNKKNFILFSFTSLYLALQNTYKGSLGNIVDKQILDIRNSIYTMKDEFNFLFDNMLSGCVYSRVITDGNGNPINYVPVAVNKPFEKTVGKKAEEIVGKLINEVHPGLEKDEVDWIKVYSKVAMTGEKLELESYSEIIDRWVKISAWSPKTGDFIVFTEDITVRKKTDIELKKLLKYKRTITEVSAKLVNAPTDKIDDIITDGLAKISPILESEWTTIMLFNDNETELEFSYEWISNEFKGYPLTKGLVATDQFKWLSRKLISGEVFFLSPLPECLPAEAVNERDFVQTANIKSTLFIPLKSENVLLGTLLLNSITKNRSWEGQLFENIKLTAEIFANSILRKRSNIKLQKALKEIELLKNRLESENIILRDEIKQSHNFDDIIGDSSNLLYALHRTEQVAPTDAPVLILGETGTGKELIARAIHSKSKLNKRPLIKIDCTNLPGQLIESELFGHEKGAFTGAHSERNGRFEIADGSTVFLDEIGELSRDVQAKLLRILEHGEFERLGSSVTKKINVRIIAATNRNLEDEVLEGRFRQDLYYRLKHITITVPPLRQRTEDIKPLAQYFINKYSKKLNKKFDKITKRDLEELKRYSWPGNIRELEFIVESAVILSKDDKLSFDIPKKSIPNLKKNKNLKEFEKEHILSNLLDSNWKIEGREGAAERLGLNPSTLRAKMKKLNIQRP
jgi:transcriptional regulator with GAF, ATPase, and Fis domain